MKIGRTGSGPFLKLEDNLGTFDDLVIIKTGGKYRKEIIEQVRCNIGNWMNNPHFDNVRTSPLDLAIIARINPRRIKSQDVDNIAKVVIDALKKTEEDPRFLFYDDCQVVRLLIWKIPEREVTGYNTDSLTISFRIHDNRKQMVLIEPRIM
ncbi:RusA family crossover junction endodeoxyribonuclease [bacterium]|nr:RusA family crossover junction endodeoxyribonuclease [bacterium]